MLETIVPELYKSYMKTSPEVHMLQKLVGQKIRVWSVLATTVGGIRGTWKNSNGVLTSIDDEFICLDNNVYIKRMFITRIEPF